jgi:hypothetical protein
MIRHTIPTVLTAEDLTEILTAVSTLENKLGFTLGLTSDERRSLPGMGPQTKSFADQALQGAILNAGLIPADLDIPAITRDKALREQLLPCLERLRALTTKVDHTVHLLGSEYFAGALAIYKALKAFGPSAGLQELLTELKLRFVRARASGESTNPTPEEPII